MLAVALILAMTVALATLPVMFFARIVGAKRAGFGFALLAVTLVFALAATVRFLLPNEISATAVNAVASSAVFAYTLGISALKGFVISVAVHATTFVVFLLLSSSFVLLASATDLALSPYFHAC